jgi:hypothetical protein
MLEPPGILPTTLRGPSEVSGEIMGRTSPALAHDGAQLTA